MTTKIENIIIKFHDMCISVFSHVNEFVCILLTSMTIIFCMWIYYILQLQILLDDNIPCGINKYIITSLICSIYCVIEIFLLFGYGVLSNDVLPAYIVSTVSFPLITTLYNNSVEIKTCNETEKNNDIYNVLRLSRPIIISLVWISCASLLYTLYVIINELHMCCKNIKIKYYDYINKIKNKNIQMTEIKNDKYSYMKVSTDII